MFSRLCQSLKYSGAENFDGCYEAFFFFLSRCYEATHPRVLKFSVTFVVPSIAFSVVQAVA